MIERESVEITAPSRERTGALSPGLAAVRAVDAFSRRKPLGAIGGAITLLLILVALLAPIISPYPPRETHGKFVYAPPQSAFYLGTDHVGRDVLSRLIHGARISLYVGLGSVLIGITAGFVVGVISTYIGGALDLAVQRVVDALMALPGLIISTYIGGALAQSSAWWTP